MILCMVGAFIPWSANLQKIMEDQEQGRSRLIVSNMEKTGALPGEKDRLIRELQEELFEKEGEGWFRIVSGSMRPLIDVGDRVLAKRVGLSDVKARDIVVLRNREVLVTHRVLKIFEKDGTTVIFQKGDSGSYASLVAAECVTGKVVAIEKDGRILRLDRGRIRVVNTLLGLRNSLFYQFDVKIRIVKQWLRDKPGFPYLRRVYRILRKPFTFLKQA